MKRTFDPRSEFPEHFSILGSGRTLEPTRAFLIKILEARDRNICKLIQTKKKTLENAPEGSLRCSGKSGERAYYYVIKTPDGPQERYLGKDEMALAKRLAQKRYDMRVLACAEEEHKFIQRYLNLLKERSAESVYTKSGEAVKNLISPSLELSRNRIRKWEYSPFDRKTPPQKGFESEKGEMMRSKTERHIGNELYRHHIPYHYEEALTLISKEADGSPYSFDEYMVIHPDFTILDKRTGKLYYWEHLGMLDKADYVQEAMHRLFYYEKNGLHIGENVILTFESGSEPLTSAAVEEVLQKYFL